MNFRLAEKSDLPFLKIMYADIVQYMYTQHIEIWDEVYPCTFLENDILQQQLYVLEDNQDILAAFALCNTNQGAKHITWENDHADAVYIDRFGVHVDHMKQGIGRIMLKAAMEYACTLDVLYIRLFVVDINRPAINLYEAYGFNRAEGYYDEVIDGTTCFHEFGYEYKL